MIIKNEEIINNNFIFVKRGLIMKNISKLFLFIFLIIFLSTFHLYSLPRKNFEKRFQVGLGGLISSSNLLNFINNIRTFTALDSLNNGGVYEDLSPEQKAVTSKEQYYKLRDLGSAFQKTLFIANILATMEYSIQLRILWKILIFETDLSLLPFNGSYNGRLDFTLTINGGIRAPFWFMPYILCGVNFAFQFYPDEVYKIEKWKSDWGAFKNFVFRPGINVRAGLDIKFRVFSIGAYYQYTVKDFEEFTDWLGILKSALITGGESAQSAGIKAAGMVLGAQSKFGVNFCWYLF